MTSTSGEARDADLLRFLIWVYYIPLWSWGVYGTFFAGPPTFVKPVMGQYVYDAWIWLHVVATTIVMAGLILENRLEKSDSPRKFMGTSTQAAGHACMFWVLLAYEFSSFYSSYWGQGTYSFFVIIPYVIGCASLTAQTVIKTFDTIREQQP